MIAAPLEQPRLWPPTPAVHDGIYFLECQRDACARRGPGRPPSLARLPGSLSLPLSCQRFTIPLPPPRPRLILIKERERERVACDRGAGAGAGAVCVYVRKRVRCGCGPGQRDVRGAVWSVLVLDAVLCASRGKARPALLLYSVCGA